MIIRGKECESSDSKLGTFGTLKGCADAAEAGGAHWSALMVVMYCGDGACCVVCGPGIGTSTAWTTSLENVIGRKLQQRRAQMDGRTIRTTFTP